MKKNFILWTVMLVGLTACGGPKQASTEGVTKEQISFPIGERINNPAFTGEAYLKPLIAVDSVFNLPQTNVVTFGPGAHSSWHRHGGMVVLVTDGVGLCRPFIAVSPTWDKDTGARVRKRLPCSHKNTLTTLSPLLRRIIPPISPTRRPKASLPHGHIVPSAVSHWAA